MGASAKLVVAWGVHVVLLAAACGTSSNGGSLDGGLSGRFDAGQSSDAAGMCRPAQQHCTPSLNACAVPDARVALIRAPWPTPTGGTIVPGTYVMDSIIQYDNSDGGTDAGTEAPYAFRAMHFFGNDGSYQFASYLSQIPMGYGSVSGTFSTAGTTLSFRSNCPSNASIYSDYSATPTTLTLYQSPSTAEGSTLRVVSYHLKP